MLQSTKREYSMPEQNFIPIVHQKLNVYRPTVSNSKSH
jgi:hypothetical protein